MTPETPPEGLEAERSFQSERAGAIEVEPTPASVVDRYGRHRHWRLVPKECVFRFIGEPRDLRLLDFGCGEGELSVQLAALGARVTGVDVSPELLALARRRAELDGVADRVRLCEGDIGDLELVAGFDVVVCSAVLHHVELRPVFERLHELLKPGGTMVVQEPIAFSRGLQRLRDLVPVEKDVSPEERQLTRDDISYLRGRMDDVETRYFHLSARATRLFPGRPGKPWSTRRRRTVYTMLRLDRFALDALPPLRRFAGIIVMRGTRRTD